MNDSTIARMAVNAALCGMSPEDRVRVLLGILAEEGRTSGDQTLFMALVHEAIGERLGSFY